jgi:ABC-type spermidine/putrescine transport system permease subunit II
MTELQSISVVIGILTACVSVVVGVINSILSSRRAEKNDQQILETRQAQLFIAS